MNKLFYLIFCSSLLSACAPSSEMSLVDLKAFINDEDNGYVKTIDIADWRYQLLLAPTQYFMDQPTQELDKGIVCVLEIGNTTSGPNRLPSVVAADQLAGTGSLSNYYTYQAQQDGFLLLNDTEEIVPHSYLFEPGLSIQDSDRLLYSFDLSETMIQKIEAATSIRFVFTDHILGHGIINFTLDQHKISYLSKISINEH